MPSCRDTHLWLCLVWPVSFCVFNLFLLSLVPLCRLGLHSSIRWRSAWLSCTCGPPRALSKSKVALITMVNLFLSVCLAAPVITHFVFTPSPHFTCICFNNLALSQRRCSLCFHFLPEPNWFSWRVKI